MITEICIRQRASIKISIRLTNWIELGRRLRQGCCLLKEKRKEEIEVLDDKERENNVYKKETNVEYEQLQTTVAFRTCYQ